MGAIVLCVVAIMVWAGVVYMASAGASPTPAAGSSPGQNVGLLSTLNLTAPQFVALSPGDPPSNPTGAAYDPADGLTYIFTESATDPVLNGTTLVGAVFTGVAVHNTTYDPADHYLYALDYLGSQVSVISGTHIVANITVGLGAWGSIYDPTNGYVYVSSYTNGTVSVISGVSVLATVSVGARPCWLAYDAADQEVYVPNSGSYNVSVISGTAVVATMPAPMDGSPVAATYAPSTGNVYISTVGYPAVDIVNGTTVLAMVVGSYCSQPNLGGYDPANGWVYVPCLDSDTVMILNDTTTVTEVAVGSGPIMAVYDPQDRMMFVPSEGVWPNYNGSVTAFSGSTVAATVYVGAEPTAATYVASTSSLLFPSENQTVSSVGSGSFANATLVQAGLPVGTHWSGTVGPLTLRANTPKAAFHEKRTTHSWSASPESGYKLRKASGTLSLYAGPKKVAVVYEALYTVTVNEIGLASGTSWSVIIAGHTYSGTGTTLSISLPNGTYRVRVVTVGGYSVAPHPYLHVLGAPASESLSFVRVPVR